jgi:hypothetical protein
VEAAHRGPAVEGRHGAVGDKLTVLAVPLHGTARFAAQ